METAEPSRTAFVVALARAQHQNAEPKIFSDSIISQLLQVEVAELPQPADEFHRRLQFYVAGRSRYAEDVVSELVSTGCRQVVILGAGLDTFAYRNPYPDVRVFEVDHPSTQAWKRSRLREAEIPVPETAIFVPVDFETEGLAGGLAKVGFDRNEPACFVWLGVITYLTREAIRSTFDYIAGQCNVSHVVFDYSEPPSQMAEGRRAAFEELSSNASKVGEPWLTQFTVVEIAGQLEELGFDAFEDLDAARLYIRYLGQEPEWSEPSTSHVARASAGAERK